MKLPTDVRDEAELEAYEYLDKHIRKLPRRPDGTIDSSAAGFSDNDADAFRHAYVSGVLTQEFSESTADILGRLNEYLTLDLYSNSRDPRALNMDLWNNSVGRKYGKLTKNRRDLLKQIHEALTRGELITELSDPRQYSGAKNDPQNASKPILVLAEDENGRNEVYMDVVKKQILSCSELVALIQSGKYPGYSVKEIKGVLTPVSNPDSRESNNLG